MKVLVIPDVHLKPWMFDRASGIMKSCGAECAVCLMDMPDDWNEEYNIELYRDTFDSAIRFQKTYPHTLWCYGNHDLSYIWNQNESGFSMAASQMVNEKLAALRKELPANKQMSYIHRIDNVLFVHGGLTEAFAERYASKEDEDTDLVLEKINGLGCSEMWSDDSPIWFRPQECLEKMYKHEGYLQVVGHTPVDRISRDWNVISCDVFSTYWTGEPIGTQEFLLVDTVTWEYRGVK